ncbi:hypothetical protein SAMD00019534_025480 [Acytostelium subglobosum LB1]|uniref:hypothetical protein n=1 Tax=Acytostelium subglobosum LB1 TaxID=1410327 RepID=UPI000644DCE4|nr:hypothetical protein SAMD00019534_025480 [Acytostelium subglobosum LB1]GAM19373.1 hypothetical protein SAMD00019534_025480 [Acytostelium subglobosum LB1]|eukprot:XP_012757300.1 hypothetical protein SAMD00019534_025480 [Acytostelium subglobosum LB1]
MIVPYTYDDEDDDDIVYNDKVHSNAAATTTASVNITESDDNNNNNNIDKDKAQLPMATTTSTIRSVSSFEKLDCIGEGTYGIVYKGRDKDTGRIVALKKVKMEKEKDGMPLTSLREIELLKQLNHPNIVRLLEVVVGSSVDSIYLVFEYVEHDIAALVDHINKPFKESEVKCFILQLLKAVEYLHARWIIHRDLKCSNLLYGNDGFLKLADFGLARKAGHPAIHLTPKVVTLWYRAPEILLGDSKYTPAIDIWAVGCIFGELLLGSPFINGNNEIEQLKKIFYLLGSPNNQIWPAYSSLPLSNKLDITHYPYSNLRNKLSQYSNNCIDLMNKLLTYDPMKRLTASEALRHPPNELLWITTISMEVNNNMCSLDTTSDDTWMWMWMRGPTPNVT